MAKNGVVDGVVGSINGDVRVDWGLGRSWECRDCAQTLVGLQVPED
jgi:hypothetical protein